MALQVKRSTRGQRKGRATRVARAAARMNRLRALSDEGVTMEDAAQAVGMSKKGVKSMLTREVGSARWPIRQEG